MKEVKLFLKGNVSEVVGEGEENKSMFLSACTLKLSKNNTRDVRCVDIRQGPTSFFVVDIEGAPKTLEELAKELKTKESFVLGGYANFAIEKVDVIWVTTTTESPPEEIEVTLSNVTQLSNTTTTALAAVIKEVKLVLKGNFSDVVGKGIQTKQMFLAACTLKLSKNNTRDLRCVDVRPGPMSSFIVDIEGAPKKLEEMAQQLKTEESFVLEGYAELTIEKVDVVVVTSTTKSPDEEINVVVVTSTTKSPDEEIKETSEDIGAQIIKYLMENGSVPLLFTHQRTSEWIVVLLNDKCHNLFHWLACECVCVSISVTNIFLQILQ